MSDDDRLAELANQLPVDRPDDARRDAVRASLLAAAKQEHEEHEARSPRYPLIGAAFVAGALAAAAATYLFVRPDARATAPIAAQVEASPSADVERQVVHDGAGHLAEVVHVRSGSVRVASAHRGELVHVATADARVEGEGAYDLEVADDHLRAITVRAGSAKLSVRDQQVIVLAAGQTWKAPVITAEIDLPSVQPPPVAAPPVPVRVPAPARVPAPTSARAPVPVEGSERVAVAAPPAEPAPAPLPAPAAAPPAEPAPAPSIDTPPRTASPTEQHFAAGWALLKQGKADEAARELGVAADSDGDPKLAADARYFQAVALTRAGRKTEAEQALVAFLDHAPTSLRRGRAAVMLAKLIAERGDAKAARAWFQSALADPDPAVVAAARAGLAAL
jgi:hypothetical protein